VKAPGEDHPAAQAGGSGPVTKMMSFLYLFYPIQDELIGGFKLSNYLTVMVMYCRLDDSKRGWKGKPHENINK